jgi:hypothetical protein
MCILLLWLSLHRNGKQSIVWKKWHCGCFDLEYFYMYFYQYALKMVDNLFFLFTASFQTRLHFAERIKPQDVSCCGVISFYCLFSLFLKNSKIEKSNGVRSGDLACQISLLTTRLRKLFEKYYRVVWVVATSCWK